MISDHIVAYLKSRGIARPEAIYEYVENQYEQYISAPPVYTVLDSMVIEGRVDKLTREDRFFYRLRIMPTSSIG